jgi:2-hydroxychromene-2-carboxylate isomerase
MSSAIDYYFSLVSPWSYIGHAPFLEIARRRGASIAYKPLPLNDVFSETGGLPLARRHPVRQAYRMVELQRWRARRGLAFHLTPAHWPFDADPGNRAILAILAAGGDPGGFVQAAFAGVWEGQRDLADPAVLAELLGRAGFDAPATLARADSPGIRAAYDRNRLEAIALGVFGAPTYVRAGEIFWGQDRLDQLDEALASGRAPVRAAV